MDREIEIVYTADTTDVYISLAEYFHLIGVNVYENYTSLIDNNKKEETYTYKYSSIPEKIFLVHTVQQLLEVEQESFAQKTVFMSQSIYEEINSHKEYYSIENWKQVLEQDVLNDDSCRQIFQIYLKYELYRYIYMGRHFRRIDDIVEKALKQILNAISETEHLKESPFKYYSLAYMKKNADELSDALGRKRLYGFDTLINDCDKCMCLDETFSRAMNLKGKIYSYFGENYTLGNMYLKSTMSLNDYSSPYEISLYWKNVNPDTDNNLKYLKMSEKANGTFLKALYNIGNILEEKRKITEAIEYYEKIIAFLREKEEKNILQLDEFRILCLAYKRIGCRQYTEVKNPDYEKAIEIYKKLCSIWTKTEDNKFINTFLPQQYRDSVKKMYIDSINLRALMASMSKLYHNLKNEKMENAYYKLYVDGEVKIVEE